jgi:hypothetical protein
VSYCTTEIDTLLHNSDSPVLALSRKNTNAAEIVLFLHRLSQVLVEYFKELEEESIRDNFVIIYELLDEMMDFGYPQTTESKILQELVHPTIGQLCSRKQYIHQVYHPGVSQIRDTSPTPNGRHKRRFLAFRGDPVPQKRGIFGCH